MIATMRRPALLLALATLAAPLALRSEAGAIWPPPPTVPREGLSDPMYWPDDPGFAMRNPTDDGQWDMYSWIPSAARMFTGFRTQELALGSGNNTDSAWQVTIGDPRVLIAVLDSGIKWDERDLQLKAALNVGELPMPRGATSYDANGDGVVNVGDYLNDPRIPCGGATLPHPLRMCRGADGMPDDPNGNGLFDAGDLIRAFSDGADGDHNGYVDDIAGWDFFKDDNDPYDDVRYGHGTGEANDSTAETNNGIGDAGNCPRCMFVPLRVGDSFTTDSNDYAQAVVYATDARYGDGRVRVVQEALGALNLPRFAAQAMDYAYAHDVVVIASASDLNSNHANMPGTANHAIYTHAVMYTGDDAQHSRSFLGFNNCTNYGPQLQLSVAATSCSSGAVGRSSGIAGLMYSEALATSLTPPLSAEEARQLLIGTVDDINIPESLPTANNYDSTLYPSLPGWDQRFGYGRVNARRLVEAVRDRRLPPEVDITSPRWFTTLFADRAPTRRLRLEGRIAARRAPRFDYTIEWGRGVEVADGRWTTLRSATDATAAVTDTLAELDLADVVIDNVDAGPDVNAVEYRYAITVRVRATAHYGAPVGDVTGEARRTFFVHRDEGLMQGFPIESESSFESSPHLADLDGDGHRDIVIADSGGVVHAIRSDGSEVRGFPVHTDRDLGFDPDRTPSYRGAPAYSGATPAINPDTLYETVIGTPAITDLDVDGTPEIVVPGYHGTVYAFNHDGTPYGHGFPRRLPAVPSSATGTDRLLDRAIFGPAVAYDLDRDGDPEIIVGGSDGKVYAIDGRTAADHPGFPVEIHYPLMGTEHGRVWGPVGVGNFNGDNVPDLLVVSNEKLAHNEGFGAAYLVHGDGNLHPGGPYHTNWPVPVPSAHILPLVGEGYSSAPPIADVDHDGRDEMIFSGVGTLVPPVVIGAQPPHAPSPDGFQPATVSTLNTVARGPMSTAHSPLPGVTPAFGLGSFGDLTGDGRISYVLPGASLSLAGGVSSGTRRTTFEHLLGAWDVLYGDPLPGFPRVVEDYSIFVNPALVDVSGDGYAEALVGTGGYYLHAFDACGREAPGFPRFTGQWMISSPAVGDLDGDADRTLEVTTATRTGYLYAWRTHGREAGNVQWPSFRHDNANTGNYGSTLDFGARTRPDGGAISCADPVVDAGATLDGSVARPPVDDSACGCTTPGRSTRGSYALTLLALASLTARRRRTRAGRSGDC